MLRVHGQAGFVLHARRWRETSLLLEMFTADHGRVGLVARGVCRERSRFPRALLQPLQALLVSFSGRGELLTLTDVEAAAAPLQLAGTRLFAALYVNELVLRLTRRGDPHTGAFADYARCLQRLSGDEPAAWTLRRFERDLVAHLGYGLMLERVADGGADVVADERYVYDVEAGPRPASGAARDGIGGAALLALAADERPDAAGERQLLQLMRRVISHHLDGGRLKAWDLHLPRG